MKTRKGERAPENGQGNHFGFALLKKYRGDMSALRDNEVSKYHEAMHAVKQAMAVKEFLGEDVSPEHAAEVFAQLAKSLHDMNSGSYNSGTNTFEEGIALLASVFDLRSEDSGIGNVLQIARDHDDVRLPALLDRLRSARLRPIIAEAFVFLKELNAARDPGA